MRLTRVLAALVVLPIGATAAFADSVPIDIQIDATVIPNKAGTPKKPQGVVVKVKGKIGIPEAYDPPLVDTIDVWFPKAGNFNGGKFPKCTETVLARKGVKACPKGSIMGSGGGKATADTVFTYPKVTIVNGGQTKIFFYTTLNNPARVQAPVPVSITKQPAGSKWGYRAHAKVPSVLQIVAGIPIVLREFHGQAGRGDWIATTSCPKDHLWRYHVDIGFTTGETKAYDGTVPCRS
jgi:hypothetical protein